MHRLSRTTASIALLALASSNVAHAAPETAAISAEAASAPRAYIDLASTRANFDCSPAPIGAGTAPTIRTNTAGTVAWWYCATPNGQWRVNWAVATSEQMSVRNMVAEIRAVLLADDRGAAFDAAVAKNVKVPVSAPALLAVWRPYIAEMNAGKPDALPIASITTVPGGTLSSLLSFAR